MDNDAKENTGKAQTDNGGRSVNGIDQVLAYSYNVKGEVTEMKRDNNVDGKYDYREAYTLDANGRQIQKEIDLTNDGTFDRKEVYTKEADDGLVKANFYNLVEGREVLTKVEDYTLNTNNHRTSVKVDTLGDGTTDIITRYGLNALGRIAKAYFDTNGDNQVDRAEIYTLDENGYVKKTEIDIGNNGIVDSNIVYERDALGRIVKQLNDSNNNGSVDTIRYYERDVYGNLLKDSTDIGADGSINSILERKFDETGREVWRYFDRTGNGLTNDDSIYYLEYNDYGQNVKFTNTNAISRAINSIDYYEYNDLGQIAVSISDRGGDGIFEQKILSEYDPVWNQAYKLTYLDGAGNTIQYIDTYEFNDVGTIIRTFRDLKGDGTVDRLEFGSLGGAYTVNHQEDLTNWTVDRLEKIKGMQTILLSNSSVETEITLNSATISKIAPAGVVSRVSNTLTINGDATDTVNLKGTDFTKLSTTHRAGTNTFDMYSTEVDGKTYTLYIDNDIQTVIG